MSSHNEDVLQYRINAYEKRIADLDAQIDALVAKPDAVTQRDIFKEVIRRVEELEAQIAAKDAALLQVLASLVATTSLIVRAEDMKVKPSKAVASNAMFTQMLKDYDNATIAGRGALAAPTRETK